MPEMQFQRPNASAFSEAVINAAANGDNTIISAVTGQRIRVWAIFLVTASSVAVTVKDGASTNLTGAMTLGSLTLDPMGEPWFTVSAGNAFVLNLGGAVQCSGRVYYTQA